MYRVFPALEHRFNANRRLVQLARKLYRGLNGQPIKGVREHVDVTGAQIEDEDTFGTDEPVYELIFHIYGGSSIDKVGLIMEELERTFKHADLQSGHFDTCDMTLEGADGPDWTSEKVVEGEMVFRLHVCRKALLPASRMS